MISAFVNSFKIPELRNRLLFTLGILALCRLGAAIPVPGVDAKVLSDYFSQVIEKQQAGNIVGMLNIFSGGAIENCAIFSLNVMPYITASIIFQLLTAVVPTLQKVAKEEGGRQKINQYTRYATVIICLFQSYLLAINFEHPETIFTGIEGQIVADPGMMFRITTMITLTTGTMLMMWLGERITEKGIGQGVSLLIAGNILARFPSAIHNGWALYMDPTRGLNPVHLLLFVGFFFGVIAAVVVITQAVRKITVQHAQRMVGRKVAPGGQTFLPLRVNYSGVMPIIFASAILMFPNMIQTMAHNDTVAMLLNWVAMGTPGHMIVYAIMVFFFSYFWVATVFNPIEIADNLKKYSAYIPGVRPGKPTAEFLDYTMIRLTFAGATALTVVAIIPDSLYGTLRIDYTVASFFGGTSLLIIVGVLLDTLRQVETHLITRNYEGFLTKGKIRGRGRL